MGMGMEMVVILGGGGGGGGKGRVRTESVVEAATLAAKGQPFEVVYYPRASTPEFCVKAAAVRASMRVRWCSGMRFKMAFETEDSSRISWFMGTISSAQVADPIRWPDSPWRLLQVSWDEPDLLQNVKRVSPWLVELVSNVPSIHLAPFSPQRKKLRIPNHPDFPPESHQLPIPAPPFSNPFVGPSGSLSASIQGARHAHLGISLSDLHFNKLQSGSFHPGYFHHCLNHHRPPIDNEVSCLLTIGSPATNRSSCNMMKKTPHLVLFGQTILTEAQISLSSGNSSSDGNNDNGVENSPSLSKDQETIGHCKVFMESEDVGRTLDLTVFGSYDELYGKLADMFGIERSEITSHLQYRDETGAVKHTGDAPFSKFMKTARRLTILMDSSSDTNVGV